jgi:hypothetical protein
MTPKDEWLRTIYPLIFEKTTIDGWYDKYEYNVEGWFVLIIPVGSAGWYWGVEYQDQHIKDGCSIKLDTAMKKATKIFYDALKSKLNQDRR